MSVMTQGKDEKLDPEQLMGGFLKKGGQTKGNVQIAVDARRLSGEVTEVPKGAGKGRKCKLSSFGISNAIVKAGDPRYAAAVQQAARYRKVRIKELHKLHGHVSSGAGALLSSASLALAASRFLYEKYATDAEAGVGDIGTLKQAASLADSARQCELAAWEMSAREGVLKRRNDNSAEGQPWLMSKSGEVIKTGRRSNLERQRVEMDVPSQDPGVDLEDA